MAKTAQVTCKFLGVLFFVAGLAGFAFGEEADGYHNLLHFSPVSSPCTLASPGRCQRRRVSVWSSALAIRRLGYSGLHWGIRR